MASFDENGKYIKTNWKAGDKITATKLNKIEESIEAVNDNDISRHVEADARLDALEAKDVAHDKEFTNVKNLIADNKAAAELGDYEINSRMQFLEQELNEGIEEVHNVASTVDGKIAQADANMKAQVDQGKADMEAMVAEVEDELDGILLALKDKANFIVANSFEGATGGEKIQNALDSEYTDKGVRVVVVDHKCGDEDYWILNSPLRISSNTCLLLNGCYLKLSDGVNNAIINNSDFDNGDNNIHIIGIGNPILDCNRNGQDLNLNNYKNIGLHLYNVDNFSIKGITLKDCARWSLVPEKCTNGLIDDICFDNKGYVNQDGVHIIGPSSNITCTKIRGVLGDDACVVNARLSGGGSNVFQGYGTGGDISDIIFDDINIEGGVSSHTGILRTSASSTTKISNIIISNAIGRNLTDGLLRLGGNDTTDVDLHGGIVANNIIGYSKNGDAISLINLLQPVSNVKVTNAKVFTENRKSIIDTNGKAMKNILLENVDYTISKNNTTVTNNASAFRFYNSTITDFTAINIRHIDNDGSTDYSDSSIINGQGASLDNFYIDGFYSEYISAFLKRLNAVAIGKIRINNYKLNMDAFDTNMNNSDTNKLILNNFCKLTGPSEDIDEDICNIGDVIRYKTYAAESYKNYLKIAPKKYELINMDSRVSTTIERFTINDIGTIPAGGFAMKVITAEGSNNGQFYQLKPSFDMHSGLLYSYWNRNDNEIKLTIFNARTEAYTFGASETEWIGIKIITNNK